MATIIDGPHREFAIRICDARRMKKLTQEELAQRLAIDRRSVSQWENGRAFPRATMLRRIAEELGVEALYLARGIHRGVEDFLDRQREAKDESIHFERREMVYIEEWEQLVHGRPGGIGLPRFTLNPTKPWELSDPARFIPVTTRFSHSLRATRIPGNVRGLTRYPAGSVVVFEGGFSPKYVPSGSDVVFAILSGDGSPRIHRLFQNEDVAPVLIPQDVAAPQIPVAADPVNVVLLGIIRQVWVTTDAASVSSTPRT